MRCWPLPRANSDDFVFDNQIIAQAVAAGVRIGEVSCPTRYQADASSINLRAASGTASGSCAPSEYRLHRWGLRHYAYLDLDPSRVLAPPAAAGEASEPSQAAG